MAINVLTVSGNIGRNCEKRYTPNGKCIADFPIAVTSGFGEREKTSWLKCKLLGNRAEKLTEYLTIGTRVVVSGQFSIEVWMKGNEKQYTPELLVNSLDFVSKSTADPMKNNTHQQQQIAGAIDNEFDDDIPF
ncbi:single-stranded DNA-binding protein [Aliikangiella coralliicola]|uniref:Single-stranded DNA-binding protein n=1 Tax=Aliikangiella coralliicola TaxID=2592383 RepID=A0A545U033_9GAMM|nr:single-stranded DNA-binding protein [Aliikangiella coralliicola]TQV82821.1 single-stranded DNA-binding protein [Aliikangiella coralliicola]